MALAQPSIQKHHNPHHKEEAVIRDSFNKQTAHHDTQHAHHEMTPPSKVHDTTTSTHPPTPQSAGRTRHNAHQNKPQTKTKKVHWHTIEFSHNTPTATQQPRKNESTQPPNTKSNSHEIHPPPEVNPKATSTSSGTTH
ncbi:hypothetical protein RIU96_05390 [Corynebacterium sp. Z-1]|nr:hypothetical protein [Corynebacterium sp. Z-1]WNI13851.1 hypothetical protein RIU96_05390 [Corynebacterium sp. Z-1]